MTNPIRPVSEDHKHVPADYEGEVSAMHDPMEQIIAEALRSSGTPFVTDQGGANPAGLDFFLPDENLHIEVKRFHSHRIAEQMSRVDNVVAVQGEHAVRWLATRLAQFPSLARLLREDALASAWRYHERAMAVEQAASDLLGSVNVAASFDGRLPVAVRQRIAERSTDLVKAINQPEPDTAWMREARAAPSPASEGGDR